MTRAPHRNTSRTTGARRPSSWAVIAAIATCIAVAVASPVSAAVVQTLQASVTAGVSGSVSVSWNPPSGADATDYSYTLYYRPTGSVSDYTRRSISAGTTSTQITGLDGGQSYEVRVSATPTDGDREGDEGCDLDSTVADVCDDINDAASVSVTAAETPAAPSITSVTAGNGEIQVAFSPGDTNGATLGQYTVSCGAISNNGASSPITVTGLTNGVARTCTVTVASNVGDSAASAASDSVTPSTTPDTMDGPGVVAGNGSVTVSWDLVEATDGSAVQEGVIDDGGSAVTGYEISITDASSGEAVTSATALASEFSKTISSSLVNGTSYKARVRATNANGSGTYSDYSDSFTPTGSDVTSPTITVARSGSGTLKAGQTETITFTLSESSTDFELTDVTRSGGTLTSFTGSGTAYSATFTPTASSSGTASISVAAGTFTDAAANSNTVSNTLNIAFDTSAPTVTVGRTGSGTLGSGGTAAITFTLSESSANFAAGDVSATGGTISGFAGSGTSYTATFTLTATGSGNATVSVSAGTFTDAAGNSNTASNTLEIAYNTSAPTVTVGRTGSGTLLAGGTAAITFTLSESSSNFVSGDVSVTGGTISDFAGSGTSYTATFNLTATGEGTASISVAAGAFTNGSGTSNTASNTLNVSYDTSAPTVTVGRTGSGTLGSGGTAAITITLSESSTNFASGDVSVTGGTISDFAGSGTSYTATFTLTATGSGDATVSVAAGAFTDAAGNSNTVSNTLEIGYDTVAPTVTVGRTGSGTLDTSGTAAITFTLSESSSDFASGDVSVTGGTISSFAGSGTSYTATFTLTATGSGNATVSVSAGTFTDAAGNSNTVSNTLNIAYDTGTSTPPPPPPTTPTTVPTPTPTTTPTTVPPVPTQAPGIVVPSRLGAEVPNLPSTSPRVAEDLAIATRPGLLTVLIDPSEATGRRAIVRYVVTVTSLRDGSSVARTLIVSDSTSVLRARFSLPRGRYVVDVDAVNARGRSFGWSSGSVLVAG